MRNQSRWGAQWAKNQKNVQKHQKLKFSSEFIKLNFIKELMTTALPHKNSKFRIFPVLVESLIKILYGKFPIKLEKIPIFFTKMSVTFFRIFLKKVFYILGKLSRKYKMSSTFFHFGEKLLLKNVPLKQNNTFSKSFATEKLCVLIKN